LYDKKYLSFGFTFSGDKNKPVPQCVICSEILSNNSMKPYLLERHFNTKHAHLKDKSIDFFERKTLLSTDFKLSKIFPRKFGIRNLY
jgi:hypothetical protein